MKKFKALQTLVERGLITEEIYQEALKYLGGSKSFISRYGMEIENEEIEEIKEVLKENIIALEGNKIYAIPLKIINEKEKKELKLYYRTIE